MKKNTQLDPALKAGLKDIPKSFGVYMMSDARGNVIYIGKAKNLKERIRSYLNVKSWDTRPKLYFMMPKVKEIKTVLTASEKDSLILEANLVNKYQPKYNVTLKDDKKFPWLMITYDEEYPRVVPIRDVIGFKKKFPKTKNKLFGPYTDAGAMWETYKILKEGFQLRIRRKPLFKDRPCMNYHIGLCSGPCQKLISYNSYHKIVEQVEDFLLGKYDVVLKDLKKQMKLASEKLEYEDASKLRDAIRRVSKVLEKQIVVSDDTKLSQDVFATSFQKDGKAMVLELFVVREGKVVAIESFSILPPAHTTVKNAFIDGIKQYYSRIDDKNIPEEVIVQHELKEKAYIEEWLSNRRMKKVKIVCPKKGKKYDLVKMAEENATHALQKVLLSTMLETPEVDSQYSLEELKEKIDLKNIPEHIECFDVSHLGGTGTVGSMVRFVDGKPDKSKYRKYKLKTIVNKIDDFASMKEIVSRRYRGQSLLGSDPLPDLIVIDGGKGQLSAAKETLEELHVDLSKVDLIGLAKKEEEVFKIGSKESIQLDKSSKALHLLQRVRNEAHRFAITYQRDTRTKETFKSELESIPQLGKAKVKRLMNYFGSFKSVQEADLQDFAKTLGQKKEEVEDIWKQVKNL